MVRSERENVQYTGGQPPIDQGVSKNSLVNTLHNVLIPTRYLQPLDTIRLPLQENTRCSYLGQGMKSNKILPTQKRVYLLANLDLDNVMGNQAQEAERAYLVFGL